ncbi:DUF2971 domain-containing protein [Lamprobacter modestohalophilus]|uniref:DUF2971 domain-containing protein n=1 Tax=Lamprobacter modestohalophilus TaxID=1064514 RepID=UPI002ADEACD5|nr:DUF2971 domain-containing protein [Lamprobacter modestohalophilus]MEA1053007.1 DUF2971 domain-containing protein [Lamprobacter modestohalophilus]
MVASLHPDMALTLFKYRSSERALEALVRGSLYFAPRQTLNDTLEVTFEDAGADEFQAVLGVFFYQKAQQRGQPGYRLDRSVAEAFARTNAAENRRFREHAEQVGIFSATPNQTSRAMWHAYADAGRGYCFELRLLPETQQQCGLHCRPVVYRSGPRRHNRAEDLVRVLEALASEHPQASIEELQHLSLEGSVRSRWGIETTARVASIKHTDWQHEQELRLLAARSDAKPLLQASLQRVWSLRGSTPDRLGEVSALLASGYPGVTLEPWPPR